MPPQIIIGGGSGKAWAVGSYYNSPFGGQSWLAEEDRRRAVASPPGKLSKFRIELDMAPGAGNSYIFTIMKNGVAQSLAVTISGTDTAGDDTTNEVDLVAGDYVGIRITYTGSPDHPRPRWALEFDPTTANNYWLSGIVHCNASTTIYGNLYGCGDESSSRGDEEAPMPTAGTVKNLYVRLNVDPGTSPDAYTFEIEKNGAGNALQVSIVADDITGHNTSDTRSYNAGDRISIAITPVAAPAVSSWGAYGVTFVPTTAGKAPVLFSAGDMAANPSNVGTVFQQPANQAWTNWDATDIFLALVSECTIADLYVYLQTAPGAGKSWKFTFRKNGADTSLEVTIADTDQSGNDTAHPVSASDNDQVSMESNPTSTPTQSRTAWGFTITAPSAGWSGTIDDVSSPAEVNDVAAANIATINDVAA